LNVSLSSSIPVSIRLFSRGNMVEYDIGPVGSGNSSEITLFGLEPFAKYYLYEDSHRNLTEFTADSNGSHSYSQGLSKQHHVWIQTSPSTYFISGNATGGDCTAKSIGTWNSAKKTCTLKKDISETVEIESNGITLDCAGHTNAKSGGYAIYVYSVDNIAIKNCTIKDYTMGIYFYYSANSKAINNKVLDTTVSIEFYNSPNGSATGNQILGNTIGIEFYNSDYGTAASNELSGNTGGIEFYNSDYGRAASNELSGNTGAIEVYYSNYPLVQGNKASKNTVGIDFYSSGNGSVINNVVWGNTIGLWLYSSKFNLAKNNSVFGNIRGISLSGDASNNTFEYNNISNNINENLYNHSPYYADAEYNWWGTASKSEISEKIFDYFDNPLYGIVGFEPWLMAPYGGSCHNHKKDITETDIDCGGICPACSDGKNCLANEDCKSDYCNPEKTCAVERDLYIEWIKPIQVVEDAPLVAGKATVVRVKVVNQGPAVGTSVRINYNGWVSEQPVSINAFDYNIVDFYPPNEYTK